MRESASVSPLVSPLQAQGTCTRNEAAASDGRRADALLTCTISPPVEMEEVDDADLHGAGGWWVWVVLVEW